MSSDRRIPFAVAIAEPELLQKRFLELSLAQRVALKALYGCSLSATVKDDKGWSELDYWAAQQGAGTYDALGNLVSVGSVPYIPKTYGEGWFVCGRRGGKTDAIAATVVAYEALLGGHEAWVRKGQPLICFQIAQDLRMAKYSLHLIKATIESSPVLASQVTDVTADRIDLKNGASIVTVPPTLKSVRGYASPVAVLDEVGVWYQDSDAANPDYEIYRAVKPAQSQFPHPILLGISSPWNKAGLLYQYYEAGTDGSRARLSERDRFSGCLVVHAPTAAMRNPLVKDDYLREEANRDPRAFEREYLAMFQDSISGFLNSQLLQEAVDIMVEERAYDPSHYYVAAIDPAFRQDTFAFTIVHADPQKGIVQDVLRRWKPEGGQPVAPATALSEIVLLLRAYRIPVVYSDQYQLESLNFIAQQLGFAISGVDFTASSKAEIYGSLQQLVNQRRIRLLDDAELLKELRTLEKRLLPAGTVRVAAPPGQHDDLATVTALAANKATWMFPPIDRMERPKTYEEKTPFERVQEQLKRRQEPMGAGWD